MRIKKIVLCFVLIAVMFAGCKNTSIEGPSQITGSLSGHVTFPDGSPVPAIRVRAIHFSDPEREPFWTDVSSSGEYLFSKLPLGKYLVSTIYLGNTLSITDSPADNVLVTEAGAQLNFYYGFYIVWDETVVTKKTIIQSIQKADIYNGAFPKGNILLLQYDLDALHIGNRYDMVKSISPTAYAFSDEGALEIEARMYKIPEDMKWNNNDPGDLTFEFFYDKLIPSQCIMVNLEPNGWGGGYLSAEWSFGSLNKEAFFQATNGVGLMLIGVAVSCAFDPGQMRIEYNW